jgi:hypothetical protein
MRSLSPHAARIAATIGTTLAGTAAGVVLTAATLTLLSSLRDENFGDLVGVLFYAPVAVVVGAAFGICLVAYGLRQIWTQQDKREPSFRPLLTVGLMILGLILVGGFVFSAGYFIQRLLG